MIEVKELRVVLGRSEVLKGVTSRFHGKHIVLGPNGHGKTTLFKAISGLVPFKGEILIEGVPLAKLKSGLGMLATNLSDVYKLVPATAWEIAKLYSDIMNVDLSLTELMLTELGISRAELERKKLWELSAGTLKAYCTVIALASGARNILLDEPFEQLDPAKKARLAKILEASSGTLVLNTHETWILNKFPDWQVHLMAGGRLYGPAPAGKLASARVTQKEVDRPLLSVPLEGVVLNFVDGVEGEPVSNLLTLDRLYDLVVRGG